MFTAKKKSLIEKRKTSEPATDVTNKFVATGAKKTNPFKQQAAKKAALTRSGNGAVKYSTTGDTFVDQFGVTGSYKKPRTWAEIEKDTSTQWGEDPLLTVCFILYLRAITRIVSLFDGKKTTVPQRGAGLRYEAIMRMIWLHVNHPDTFWKNIKLFIAVGSWKDIIQMLSYDIQYNGWEGRLLDWDKMRGLIMAGLENKNTVDLIKKYLPQIKATTKCNSIESQADNVIAKWIMTWFYTPKGEGDYKGYKQYRQFKASGKAHQWQQLISKRLLNELNFDTIHGRALSMLVSGKFLANNGLESKYDAWISTKPVAKYTGYPHELFKTIPAKPYQVKTVNSQFMGLVETAKKGAKDNTSLIVVRDISSSMGSPATGTTQSCYDIAKALALFFSYMLPNGHFANSYINFASTAEFHTWKGSTPVERWKNDRTGAFGGTDFQSVIGLFCHIKKQGVSESDFPAGILCISDSEFNPASLDKTNVETARNTLRKAGFSKEYVDNFKIILWNLQSGYYGRDTGKKFETHGDEQNVFYFSGYDASVIAFLTGVVSDDKEKPAPKTAKELFQAAMEQEVMGLVEI